MIPYSLSVAIIIVMSLVFYRAFLHRETFFGVNRAVLLCCLVLAFIVPLVHVPAKFSFRQAAVATENVMELPAITAELQVQSDAANANQAKSGVKTHAAPSSIQNTLTVITAAVIKYVPFVYWAGVTIMGTNLLVQILMLLYRSRKHQVIKDGIFRIVELEGDRAPCSFANRIFINPEKYDWETYNQILAHEKIHVSQAHTIDLLLAEMMLVFQWFNPLAWVYRKDIENNLEYLTDYSLLNGGDFDKADYQLSLVRVSAPELAMKITTNYNQSMLKKRILMMNARRSNINGMWKYTTLALLMGILICNMNEPLSAAVARHMPLNANSNNEIRDAYVTVTKQASATKPLPRNNATAPVKINTALTAPVRSLETDTTPTLKFSNTTGRIETFFEGGTFKMPFPNDMVMADAAFVKAMSSLGYASLTQNQIDSLKTAGVTPQFIKDIAALGYANLPYKILCMLKLAKVTPEYVRSFSDLGYGHLKISKIITFKFSNIEAAYIKSLQRVGLDIPLDLVTMTKSRGFTPEYVQGFKDLGYKDLPYSRISMWKAQGIDADYIRSFNKIGFNNIPESDVSILKAGEITPEYVVNMKAKGVVYADLKRYAFAYNTSQSRDKK